MPVVLLVNSSWLHKDSLRLDAPFYGGHGRKEARDFITSRINKKRLCKVTVDGESGIFLAKRFRRTYVDDSKYGYPFITGSRIVHTDPLLNNKYISKKYTPFINDLRLKEGITTITRSGSVGNLSYINKTLAGALGSDDLIRIIPDQKAILSGYLYAFLSSKIGKALITYNTYGSVIKHIEDHHLFDIPVPLLNENVMLKAHDLIEKAAHLKYSANGLIQECSNISAKDLPYISDKTREFEVFRISKSQLGFSYAGYNNSKRANNIKNSIIKKGGYQLKDISSTIFAPPLFKHIYLEKDNGYPFLTGGELQQEKPLRYRFLSPIGVKEISEYIVNKGWLVLYKSGSIDGMIGTPFLIGKDLEGFCLSDHVIRIVPDKGKNDLLLWTFSFFKSRQGKMMLKGLATGSAVPFILPGRLEDIYIPSPESKKVLSEVATNIRKSSEFKTEANRCEETAIQIVEQELSKWLD